MKKTIHQAYRILYAHVRPGGGRNRTWPRGSDGRRVCSRCVALSAAYQSINHTNAHVYMHHRRRHRVAEREKKRERMGYNMYIYMYMYTEEETPGETRRAGRGRRGGRKRRDAPARHPMSLVARCKTLVGSIIPLTNTRGSRGVKRIARW